MKIYITCNFEGLTGITQWKQIDESLESPKQIAYRHIKIILNGI